MDNIIVCNFNMFDAQQTINIVGEDEAIITVPTMDLSSSILALCYSHNIYDVHLFGNAEAMKVFVANLEFKEKEFYKNNKINIEVN